jgi:phage baseplate assembly protein V
MLALLEKALVPLWRSVRNMVGMGVVDLVDDSVGVQRVQAIVAAGDTRASADRAQNYGFTSNPLSGATGIWVAVRGNRNHPVFLAFDDARYRKKNLASGEVAIYHHEGDFVHLKNGRVIEINSGSKIKLVSADTIEETATTKITQAAPEIDRTATTKIVDTAPEIDLVASTKVRVDSPLQELTGSQTVAGNQTVTGTQTVTGAIAANGGITVTAAGGGAGVVTVSGAGQVKINGTKVLGQQQAAIADTSVGGSAADPVARGAVNSILAAMRTHGLIAP